MSHVDRHSQFTVLKKVEQKTAELVTQAALETLGQGFPVLTITYDNGKEFSEHANITKELNAPLLFCKTLSFVGKRT